MHQHSEIRLLFLHVECNAYYSPLQQGKQRISLVPFAP
jgi:hypothetical protein